MSKTKVVYGAVPVEVATPELVIKALNNSFRFKSHEPNALCDTYEEAKTNELFCYHERGGVGEFRQVPVRITVEVLDE